MYGIGQEIAAIDDRVVVKVPVTGDGIAVAARLKKQKVQVTSTAVYSSRQALAAVAVGSDYVAPYLGRMNKAGSYVRLPPSIEFANKLSPMSAVWEKKAMGTLGAGFQGDTGNE